MAQRLRRKNEKRLTWLKACFVGASTYAALASMSFSPGWGAAALGATVGALMLVAVDLGVLSALIALSLPITAADPVVGMAFLIAGILGLRYLGSDGGRVFVVVSLAFIGVFAGPAWIAVAVAAYALGASEGALAAGLACVAVETAGALLGREGVRALVTGGTEATRLLTFGGAGSPDTYFSAQWVRDAFAGFGTESVQRVAEALAALGQPATLVVQPAMWALAAFVAGVLIKRGRAEHNTTLPLVGAAMGGLLPGVGAFATGAITGSALPTTTVVIATVTSMIVGVAFVAIAERFFPLEAVKIVRAARPSSMATEDADVDELLRLISSAEEKLTTQHTTHTVVMITDMKSFSRMTEEDGSILSAKAIQRHRDLLVPVIEKHGGHGKSTGGDGLVAAFESHAGAVAAAAEMQQVLAAHNAAHPDEREMTVRIGVADGEVVLDKGGRPFIGAALNLAARVMNLADGGQSFVTDEVLQKAGAVARSAPLGEFELKNIAKPVPVTEILWAPDQKPVGPAERLVED